MTPGQNMGGIVTNPGSALGEEVGKLIELDLCAAVRAVAEPLKHSVASMRLANHLGSSHQIDAVVKDQEDNPVILIEPKYLRYRKHNWDKGSRLCIGHYRLRRTFPSIRKSIGILAGEWTIPSVEFMQSFAIETHRIPFEHISEVVERHKIPFRWHEKDTQTPALGWRLYTQLSAEDREQLAREVTSPVRQAVMESVGRTLRWDPQAPKRVETVELSVRTSEGEHIFRSFGTISAAIEYLLPFLKDVEDLRRMLG